MVLKDVSHGEGLDFRGQSPLCAGSRSDFFLHYIIAIDLVAELVLVLADPIFSGEQCSSWVVLE